MTGALLSEVWPDMVKPKKKKKSKPKKTLLNPPLSPQEMDTELLDDNENNENNENNELNPYHKLKGMRVSPYIDNELHYQNINRQLKFNQNIMNPQEPDYIQDPHYQEFLEFKKMKLNKQQQEQPQNYTIQRQKLSLIDYNEQFNELLLYVFTGFFLLIIYDNIYKLGKNSY